MDKDLLTEVIGWGAALILFMTITRQVYKQWQEGTNRGVSHWLFIGQTAASTGFLAYSWLVDNWVFVVTNAFILTSALVGQVVSWHNGRRQARRAAADGSARALA